MIIRRLAALVLLAGALASCGGIVDPSKNTVENFSGTVAPGSFSSTVPTFSVGKTGEFFVTITQLTPDSNILLGVGVGQLSGSACNLLNFFGYVNTTSQLNRQALGGQIEKGSYCVSVWDSVGAVTQTTTYSLRVSHP